MFTLGSRMLNLAKPILKFSRCFQVSVLGASRPIGQTLSLLLKQHPLIHRLTMYGDHENTPGIAMDVSHIPQRAAVEGWTGRMEFALRGSEVVVVANGAPKQTGQSELQQFNDNADSVVEAMQGVVAHCPTAIVVIATGPINHTVPLASKVLEANDCYSKERVLGVTGLDTMRARTCVSGLYQFKPHLVKVPVICGHSPKTMVPLFSHVIPNFHINNSTARAMTESIRTIDDSIADLKRGDCEPTLSSACAISDTVSAVLNAMNGFATEHVAFIANNDYGTKFFAAPVIVTWQGVTAVMQFKSITALEADYIYRSTEQLCKDVQEGEAYYNPDKHYSKYKRTYKNVY